MWVNLGYGAMCVAIILCLVLVHFTWTLIEGLEIKMEVMQRVIAHVLKKTGVDKKELTDALIQRR